MRLVGKLVTFAVGDGRAEYRITGVEGDVVHLVWVAGGPDGYIEPVLGKAGIASRANIEALVKYQEKLTGLLQKKG